MNQLNLIQNFVRKPLNFSVCHLKFFFLRIEDNKGMAGTSNLRLIIGDRNDNPMKPGASSIFVYNYEGSAPDTEIGR